MQQLNTVIKNKRFFSLDLLKFLLMICIVCHHFQLDTGTKYSFLPTLNFWGGPFYFGLFVDFFFIISGFIAAYGFDRRKPHNFSNYFLNKCIRIYPMTMLSVLFTLLMTFIFKSVFGYFPANITPNLWRIINSLTLTFCGWWTDSGLGINNPIWYLGILVIMYVVAYFCIWLSDKYYINQIYFFFFLLLLGLGIKNYRIDLPFINSHIGRGDTAFFWGMILYSVYKNIPLKYLTISSIFTLSLVILCSAIDGKMFCCDIQEVCIFTIYPSILFAFISLERFSLPFFSILGGGAYEMYIWHAPFIIILNVCRKIFNPNFFFSRWVMCCFVLFMITISIPMYLFVEKPVCTKLKRKFIQE